MENQSYNSGNDQGQPAAVAQQPGQPQYPPPQQYPPGQQPPPQQYPPGQQPPPQQYPPGQQPPPQYGQPAPYGQPVQPQYGQQYPPGQMPMQPMQGQPGGYYGAPPMGQGFAPGVPGGPPAPVQWMDRPTVAAGCPPGLEYLTMIDQLVVKQQIEILELISNWECANKYRVFNSVGQQVYFAQEESDMCMRQCCGPNRSFTIHITDNAGQEVLRLSREFKCCACGICWCAGINGCSHEVVIEAPVGQVIGYVRHRASAWKPKFTLYTADEQEIGHIEGPCCICNCPCCGDVNFPVLSTDGETKVGNVAKQWSGAVHEFFTDADTFSISFPMDMDVKMKAVMMGALFLIDFMYFEQSQNNNNH